MRKLLSGLLIVLFAGTAYGEELQSDSIISNSIQLFMTALQTGDGPVAAEMFSSQAIQQVEAMLVSIKQSSERDPEATVRRLNGVGYIIELESVDDWETTDYLSATLSLPLISARYAPYSLEIQTVTVDGRSAVVDMVFHTAAGVEIPQQAVLDYEDDAWKISNFMGITAFP